jgi:hypothetical protein
MENAIAMTARRRAGKIGIAVAFAALATLPTASARADEGGVSFWLPGQVSSFAATPMAPGFALPAIYYHASVDSGGSKQFITGGRVVAGLDADADLVFFAPTYVFADPVAGGQGALTLAWAAGRMRASVDATLTGPLGNTLERNRTDTANGGSDLYPKGQITWHGGVHNFGVYAMGDIPTGAYQVGRLANIGINHYALDGGGMYTYLDATKGHEFSATAGFTYNFENHDTDYRNGVDVHLDWALAQFLSEQWLVGLNGYAYQQVSDDSGAGATLGGFRSRVFGAGPQVGYFFPFGGAKGVVNLRGTWEWGEQNRPAGWNLYLTVSLPLNGVK